MLIIIEIPGHISSGALARKVTHAGARLWQQLPFFGKAHVKQCDILQAVDQESKSVNYMGLIAFDPPKMNKVVQKKLDGKVLFGRQVQVRPFVKRSPYRDRRKRYADLDRLPEERRKQDRRRTKLFFKGKKERVSYD
jgi:hypothetical protein